MKKVFAILWFIIVSIWAAYNAENDKALIGPYIMGIFMAGYACYVFELT